MSPVLVQLGGPDVANGTLPKLLELCGSTKVAQLAIYIASAIMGALALKNGFNAHTHAYNALRTHFGNFYSWPLRPGDLWPCSLYDHAEILHAFQVS